MAKKIRFPLEMNDGVQVRTVEELRNNFSIAHVIEYVKNGKMLIWLQDRYANDLAEKVRSLDENDIELPQKVCQIFDVKYDGVSEEEMLKESRRIERKKQLAYYTDDERYVELIDQIAFDQDELYDLLDENIADIYLCGDEFEIPVSVQNVRFWGINKPKIKPDNPQFVDWGQQQVYFEGICWTEEYKVILEEDEGRKVQANILQEALNAFKTMNFKALIEIGANEVMTDELYYMCAIAYEVGNEDIQPDNQKSRSYLIEGKEKGYPICNIAYLNRTNMQKEEIDIICKEYKVKLKEKAEKGSELALHELGYFYLYETDEPVDYCKSVSYFQNNVDENESWQSAFSLAIRYQNGQGVEKDQSKAIENYFYSLKYGHERAYINAMELLYENRTINVSIIEKYRRDFYKNVTIKNGKKILKNYIYNRMVCPTFYAYIGSHSPRWSAREKSSSRSDLLSRYNALHSDFVDEKNRQFKDEVIKAVDNLRTKLINIADHFIDEEVRFCKQKRVAEVLDNTFVDMAGITNMMLDTPQMTISMGEYEISDMQYNGLFGGHEYSIIEYSNNEYYEQWEKRVELAKERMKEGYKLYVTDVLWNVIEQNWVDM